MSNIVNEIRNALAMYSVKGKAAVVRITTDRLEVRVNGSYFGIWDAEKKTFVD